jgi:hypothetical protein
MHAFAKAAGKRSQPLVEEGIKLFDKGDFDGATKKYREALTIWPQSGWAHFELAYTIRCQEIVAAGEKPTPPGQMLTPTSPEMKVKMSAQAKAEYGQCRRYSPFMQGAYHLDEPELLRGATALVEEVLPANKDLANTRDPAAIDRDIEQWAKGCQDAGLHDLALLGRQILVARRGQYAAVDHPFIVTSLRRLVPGPDTEDVLERLAGAKSACYRLIATEDQPAAFAAVAIAPDNKMFRIGTPQCIREKSDEHAYMLVIPIVAQKPEQFEKPGLKLIFVIFDDAVKTPPVDLKMVEGTSAVYFGKDKKTSDVYWRVKSAQQNITGLAHVVAEPLQYRSVGTKAVTHWGIKDPPDKAIGIYLFDDKLEPASNVVLFGRKDFTEGNVEEAYQSAVAKLGGDGQSKKQDENLGGQKK